MTLVSGSLQAIGAESIDFLGRNWSLRGVSGALLYLFGVAGEILVLTSIYLVMPVRRPSWRQALVGGFSTGTQPSRFQGNVSPASTPHG